jgi:hypothetical protein
MLYEGLPLGKDIPESDDAVAATQTRAPEHPST